MAGHAGNGSWHVCLATGSGFDCGTWQGHGGGATNNVSGDFNGDGKTDIAGYAGSGSWHVTLSNHEGTEFLKSLTNGHGANIGFSYEQLSNPNVYTQSNDATYPEQDLIAPIYVVSKLSTDNGLGGQNTVSYHYAGGKVDLHGRGFRGFSTITQTNEATQIQQISHYERDYRYISTKVKRTETRLLNGSASGRLLSETDNNMSLKDYGNGVHYSRVDQSVSKTYELDGSLVSTSTTSNQFDDCGNPTQIRIDSHDGRIETTSNQYNSSNCVKPTADTPWLLGRLLNTEVSRAVSGQGSTSRRSSWEYAPQTGLLVKEIIEPGDALCVEKRYVHDAFGNITQSRTQGCASTNPPIASRSQSSRYDSNGRFLVEHGNALGHTERREYDKFGNKTRLIGPNQLATRWAYDGFGRPVLETRADNTWTQTAYRLHNASNSVCGGNTQYFTQSQSAGGNVNYQCFDKLDREVRKASFGFNGQLIFVDTEYNARGEVTRVSEPYFSTDTPLWSRVEYDALSRPVKQIAADQNETRIEYRGLVSVTINAKQQRKTEEKDVHGNLLKSVDANNQSVTYVYDGFNHLIEMRDAMGYRTEIFYDQRGNKTHLSDPDTGNTRYSYNALGELLSQTDAAGRTTDFTYDLLGRMDTRTSLEGTDRWRYDSTAHGIGHLAGITGADGYAENHRYDSFGRLTETETRIADDSYFINTQYDQYGRVASLTYPTGFAVQHEYTPQGYLQKLSRADNQQPLWAAETMNARGQLEQQRFGNDLITRTAYQQATGFVSRLQTGNAVNAHNVQNLSYQFDILGNLTQRRDQNRNLGETFNYDNLNRLTRVALNGVTQQSMGYDALGNIVSKSDVGGYLYGSHRPHAVTQAGNVSYSYDTVGNRISDSNGQQIQYTSFNKPALITQGSTQLSFNYNPDRERYLQNILRNGQTTQRLYLGKLYEQDSSETVVEGKHHVFANGKAVAIVSKDSNDQESTRYLHRDHLDSVESISDENGNLLNNLSFDAWGQRRSENWGQLTQEEALALVEQLDTQRGFTGHEHLDEVNLIHMNGRIYDPRIGRFLSADPLIQAPGNMQSLNRYSYVLNNPLSYTDPSGFGWLSKTFKKLKTWVKEHKQVIIGVVSAVVGAFTGGLGTVLGQAIGLSSLGTAVLSGAAFGFGSSFAGSLLSGSGFNNALKAGLTGAVIGGITGGLADFATTGIKAFKTFASKKFGEALGAYVTKAAEVVSHGVIAGMENKLKGGSFGEAFKEALRQGGFEFLNLAYQRMVGEAPELLAYNREANKKKGLWELPTTDHLNFGSQGIVDGMPAWKRTFGEGSSAMDFMGKYVPFMNAISGAHDYMQVKWTGHSQGWRAVSNIPYMIPATLLTVGAYVGGDNPLPTTSASFVKNSLSQSSF